MKIRCHRAIVSFCPDLRRPDAASRPVAIVLVATSGADAFAAVSVAAQAADVDSGLDALSLAVLNDLPRFLQLQMEAAFETADRTPAQLFKLVQDSLRNSIHLSEVLPVEDVDVDDPMKLVPLLRDLAVDGLHRRRIGVASPLSQASDPPRVAARYVKPPPLSVFELKRDEARA